MNFNEISTIVYLFASILLVRSAPTQLSDSDAMDYLTRFGYMASTGGGELGSLTHSDVTASLKRFQKMAGIDQTGVIDDKTKEMMAMPRCGNSDNVGHVRRSKRYALEGSQWPKNDLTYSVLTYTPDLPRDYVDQEIKRGFQVWSDVTPLTFTQKSAGSTVDIEIIFAGGDHGDGYPFDSEFGTLAHAFFPQYGGDVHFDEAEQWTLDTSRGINLFQVAAHEFGHALGLSHSEDSGALMAPFYRGYIEDFELHSDDIAGIQEVYGARQPTTTTKPTTTTTKPTTTTTKPTTTTTKPTTTKPTTTTTKPTTTKAATTTTKAATTTSKAATTTKSSNIDICVDAKPDAFVNTYDGKTYMFKGANYYELNDYGAVTSGLIRDDWVGLPDNIDASLYWSYWGVTYFFKGELYWRFVNKKMDRGYPRRIGIDGFAGMPSNIDAAFVWSGNGRTYFVKGDKYWRYSGSYVDTTYPRRLSVWNLPVDSLDSAMQWVNGRTYFFKGDNYYRFNDGQFTVDSSTIAPYPRSTAEWWYGCPKTSGAVQFAGLTHNTEMSDTEQEEGIPMMDDGLVVRPPGAELLESHTDIEEHEAMETEEGVTPTSGSASEHAHILPLIAGLSFWLVLKF